MEPLPPTPDTLVVAVHMCRLTEGFVVNEESGFSGFGDAF